MPGSSSAMRAWGRFCPSSRTLVESILYASGGTSECGMGVHEGLDSGSKRKTQGPMRTVAAWDGANAKLRNGV